MIRLTQTALVLAVLVLGLAPALAKAEDTAAAVGAATQAAKDWLALIDQGHYAESWQEASSLFQAAVSQDQWVEMAAATRAPLGAVQSRVVDTATFTTELPGAPDGAYVIILFQTSFLNKKAAVETVTPMRDDDGTWHVAGYFIR